MNRKCGVGPLTTLACCSVPGARPAPGCCCARGPGDDGKGEKCAAVVHGLGNGDLPLSASIAQVATVRALPALSACWNRMGFEPWTSSRDDAPLGGHSDPKNREKPFGNPKIVPPT